MSMNEITLGDSSTRFAEPIKHILQCYEVGVFPTQFDIQNAKDELHKLKYFVEALSEQLGESKKSSKENNNRWLNAERDRALLAEENKVLRDSLNNAVAWARINDRGDLYDLRVNRNPYIDESTILPLYSNKEEFKKLVSELKKPLDKADK